MGKSLDTKVTVAEIQSALALRHYDTAREAFSHLIDKVSGKGTWDRNNWQFAYTFKLVK